MRLRASFFLLAGLCLSPAIAQDSEADPAVDAVRQSGAQLLELAQDDDRLDVAYHLSTVELTPEKLGTLAGIKDRVYSLNFRGTNLNDAMAAQLAPLTELVRLHLEKTTVTDAALPHFAGMQNLEYLNLYGTGITDAAIPHLAALKNLKKVYVWETKVTLEGVHALRAALPDVEVIGGPPEPKIIHPVEASRPPAPEKPAEEKPAA